jgi:hypothetical protein
MVKALEVLKFCISKARAGNREKGGEEGRTILALKEMQEIFYGGLPVKKTLTFQ